jgi:hypothetical protein
MDIGQGMFRIASYPLRPVWWAMDEVFGEEVAVNARGMDRSEIVKRLRQNRIKVLSSRVINYENWCEPAVAVPRGQVSAVKRLMESYGGSIARSWPQSENEEKDGPTMVDLTRGGYGDWSLDIVADRKKRRLGQELGFLTSELG